MKNIPVMEVRKSLGRILDEVSLRSETFILERAGKPIAKIVPLYSDAQREGADLAFKALGELKGLNPDTERTEDPDAWLERERESW